MIEIIVRGPSGSGKTAVALMIEHFMRHLVSWKVVDDGAQARRYTTHEARKIVEALHGPITLRTERVKKGDPA